MKVIDLINHYVIAKTIHGPLSPSLAEKVRHITLGFGDMDASSTGTEFSTRAREVWGDLKAGTIRRYLVQLRAVLNRAARDGILHKAPLVELPYVNDTVHVDITTGELNKLLDFIRWTEPKWYPLVLALSHTGARLGEAMRLSEGCFTRRGTRISKITGRKTKTIERTIPYTPRMLSAIESRCMMRNGDSLVPAGIAPASVATCLGRVVDFATASLGLPTLRVHDLRHAFAAVLAENGADLADITAALGHSGPAMAMRYRGLVRGRLNGILGAVQ
jgi:integrase